jgi:hypothetical protein
MVTATTVVGLLLLERRLQRSGVQGEREPAEPMPKVWATRDPPR